MQNEMISSTTRLRLPPAEDIDTSVVIVSYNTKILTLECIASVYATKGDMAVEVIVVDNCSHDGSPEAIRAAFPKALVIDSPANGGFAYGNNIGFEQARGRAILCLNPDTRLHEGALQVAYARLFAQERTGIVGARTYWESGEQQSTLFRYLGLRHFAALVFLPARWLRAIPLMGDLRYAALDRNMVQDVQAVAGCFMLAKRALLEQQGGMDQRFFMYGEEAEWCRRTTATGWHILYEPACVITHHGAASTGTISPWKAVEMAKGHILFLRFTRGVLTGYVGTWLLFLHDVVRAPVFAVKWLMKGFNADLATRSWAARFGFLARALLKLPKGQYIERPAPQDVRR